jgi:hypothetical protein
MFQKGALYAQTNRFAIGFAPRSLLSAFCATKQHSVQIEQLERRNTAS